jgi:hypothetical protein
MMRISTSAGIAAIAFLMAPAMAQQPPAGPFDGRYSGKMTCFPSRSPAVQLRGLNIKGSKFTFDFRYNESHRFCPVQIKTDGTFDNQTCDVPMSGKADGKTLTIHFKTQDAICDVTAARES